MLDCEISVANPFFIFFTERSGSTLLVHLLNEHPEVACEHESFPVEFSQAEQRTMKNIADPVQQTQILARIYDRQDVSASGFKFKFKAQYDSYPEVYRFFLRNIDRMKLIFLYRENLLKKAVSRQNLLRLINSGEQHYLNSGSGKDFGKLELDLESALEYMQRQNRNLQFFKKASAIFQHRIVISYEELIDQSLGTLNQVLDFLDVKPVTELKEAPIRKITDDNLQNAVENYNEMVEFFQGTRFSQYLA